MGDVIDDFLIVVGDGFEVFIESCLVAEVFGGGFGVVDEGEVFGLV